MVPDQILQGLQGNMKRNVRSHHLLRRKKMLGSFSSLAKLRHQSSGQSLVSGVTWIPAVVLRGP